MCDSNCQGTPPPPVCYVTTFDFERKISESGRKTRQGGRTTLRNTTTYWRGGGVSIRLRMAIKLAFSLSVRKKDWEISYIQVLQNPDTFNSHAAAPLAAPRPPFMSIMSWLHCRITLTSYSLCLFPEIDRYIFVYLLRPIYVPTPQCFRLICLSGSVFRRWSGYPGPETYCGDASGLFTDYYWPPGLR